MVFSGVSFASVGGPVGLAGAGWRSVADSLSRAAFIPGQSDVAWAVGAKRVAELCNHDGFPGNDFLSGLAAWVFASGDGVGARGSSLGGHAAKAISESARLGVAGRTLHHGDTEAQRKAKAGASKATEEGEKAFMTPWSLVVAFGYRTGAVEMTRFNGDAPLTVVLMCSVGLPASANVKVAVSV